MIFPNKKPIIAGCALAAFFFISSARPSAQDSLIDADLEKLFEEQEEEVEKPDDTGTYKPLQTFIMGTGFGIDTSYDIIGGYLPGWSEAPWYFSDSKNYKDTLTNLIGAKMSATVGLDIRPSKYLLVRQSFAFTIPSPALTIKEFFFDYNLNDKIFIKTGKYDISWGLSPNFPFANLIARIPPGIENPGEPLLAKVNIPLGVGGFEFVLLTRPGYIDPNNPRLEDFGLGGKFNLALQNFDLDIGTFYFDKMPTRCFLSVKTTLFENIEVYTDGMVNASYDNLLERWDDLGISASAGFFQPLFKDKVNINAEFYYNGEGDAEALRRNNLLDDEPEDFSMFDGFNMALNISFKPGVFGGMRIFFGCLYSFEQNSAQIVPGITFNPAEHIEIYFSVPMAAGDRSKNSYYYHNADTKDRPFSIVLAAKIKGSYRYSRYE
ncbi:MAG: hypothetical protein LBH50_04215 [Spirochaetaceae bacterium]|nr:hypothetical protein [Spirochaetaceae bacterium]